MKFLKWLLGKKAGSADSAHTRQLGPSRTVMRVFDPEVPAEVRSFVENLSDHLERIKQQWPQLKDFLDEYFATEILAKIAPLAAEKMALTQSDGQEHSVALYEKRVCYLICTLRAQLGTAREWFVAHYGGYSQLLKALWSSADFQRRDLLVFCHVFYGWTGDSAWTHMTIIPVKRPSPASKTMLPVEFLTEEERRVAGL